MLVLADRRRCCIVGRNVTKDAQQKRRLPANPRSSVPAEAALSFLKDTKGTLMWSAGDLADALGISRSEAQQILPFLEAQGYVQRAKGRDEWITTPAGESVSGAKTPRFTRESVEQAVAKLKDRIESANKDRKSPFRITDALAFGDFLMKDRARVQPADVGIGLTKRGDTADEVRSASDAKAERAFLRQLRGRTALLNVKPHADWMRKRSHLDLL
jgi:DNA-binding transcriptional MocR family regulator